jgi:HSP20 family protein
MTNLVRWSAFDDRFDNLLRGFLGPVAAQATNVAMPIKMDVTESEKSYVVRAELPGVSRDNIKVEIDGNEVTISAETKNERDVKDGERVLRSERYYGKVYRSFVLAQDIDDAAAEAKYDNGVLRLTLTKKAAAKSKQLTIN